MNAQFCFLVMGVGKGKGPGSACTAPALSEGKWEQTCWELSRKNIMSTWGVSSRYHARLKSTQQILIIIWPTFHKKK